MLTREELAKLVIEVMDAQRRYFATSTRSQATLEASKTIERKLKHECERILEPPGLSFGDDDNG
jgi:flagellar basal body-associated protein FliL